MRKQESAPEDETVSVSENKFNGTATLRIRASGERRAAAAARLYFRETHGSKPSRVVVEEDEYIYHKDDEQSQYTVMVADHSSGSLCDAEKYTF